MKTKSLFKSQNVQVANSSLNIFENNKTKINQPSLSPIMKWKKEKKLLQVKTVISLLLSNLLTFLICMPNVQKTHLSKIKIEQSKGYSIINISAKSVVEIPLKKKVKISLINSRGKLISKAYLWPSENKASTFSDNENKNLKIEIATSNLPLITKLNFENIIVFPDLKKIRSNKKVRYSREINF